MTRRPFRELENDLEDLEAATDNFATDEGSMIAFRDARTGELATGDGEPLDPEGPDPARRSHREPYGRTRDAEKYDLEILGSSEDVPDDRDVVKVRQTITGD